MEMVFQYFILQLISLLEIVQYSMAFMAYIHVRAGTVGLGLSALEGLRFGAVGGAAQVQGLTRFAGELRLT
ncbi:MAG: hypothetical protein QXP91_10190, partial [Candidatus Methanomethylicia archaeon]